MKATHDSSYRYEPTTMDNSKVEPLEIETHSDEEGSDEEEERQSFLQNRSTNDLLIVRRKLVPFGTSPLRFSLILLILVIYNPTVIVVTRNQRDKHNNAAIVIHSEKERLRSHPPPLSSLVQGDKIVEQVNWMLDFSIIGFPKCGTSFLKYWLSLANSTYLDDHEIPGLAKNKPQEVVSHFLNVLETSNTTLQSIGMKNPGDIDSLYSLSSYHETFPDTKLIVQVRHPVLWFQSFYNFRYRNIMHENKQKIQKKRTRQRPFRNRMPPPRLLVGSCWRKPMKRYINSSYSCDPAVDRGCDVSKNSVCTNRGRFHHGISRLGLTPLNTPEEWELLQHHNMTIHPTRNKVLFVEVSQLSYNHTTPEERQGMHETLKSFLNIIDLPPLPSYSPPYKRLPGEIDICEDEYAKIRKILVRHGRLASQWIREYLLQSNQAVVANRAQFMQLLELWKTDPCT